MDDLFERLQKRGVGCYMGNYFVGCLAYADDLAILAPSKKALQIMINICQGYAADHDVIFNGPKSQFIVFRGRECKADNCDVMVNGIQLNNTSSAIHLGHRISSDDNECAISASVAQFWKAFNILRADFVTYIRIYNVNYSNNIVAVFMVHHYGLSIVIIKYVYLGERP